jgi:hypothetical protein
MDVVQGVSLHFLILSTVFKPIAPRCIYLFTQVSALLRNRPHLTKEKQTIK